MRTLDKYIVLVDEALADLTGGNFGLDNLVDFADGELALSTLFEDEVPVRDAARLLMNVNGYIDALNCWSDECEECPLEDECPHIG